MFAIAIWRRDNGLYEVAQARTYDGTTRTWSSTTTDLSSGPRDAFGPEVGIDNNGNAVALWLWSDPMTHILQA